MALHATMLVAAGLILGCCDPSLSFFIPADESHSAGQTYEELRLRSAPIFVAQQQPKPESATAAPYSSPTTPTIGSPEWKRDAAETVRRDKELARKLNGICRGC
jgi:hypothetical protein